MALPDFSSSLETRSNIEPVDPSVVRLVISELTTEQHFSVALATVLVYHSIITLDKEIRYFWPNPRSSVSITYFSNRYIGLLSAVSSIIQYLFTESLASCRVSFWTIGLASLVTMLLIDYILLIRVLALFDQDKRLGIILKVLLGLYACIGLGLLVYGIIFEGVVVDSLGEGMTYCVINRNPPQTLNIVSWLVPMANGMILLVLALYKAADYWKLSYGLKGFHLVRVLIQDQVIYYGFGKSDLLCILGGQLLINLKEAGERGANGGTIYTPTSSVSDINFGENDAVNEQNTGLERSIGMEASV